MFMAHFWSLFPTSGAKNFFLENLTVTHNFIGFLAPCQNLERTNDAIPQKHPDRRKDGQKDRQTLFHRTLSATARGPKMHPISSTNTHHDVTDLVDHGMVKNTNT